MQGVKFLRQFGFMFLITAAAEVPNLAWRSAIGHASESESGSAIPANMNLPAIEKIAVFPVLFKGERGIRVDEATAKALDDTWWQVRDELTETGRFVVASRAFLQKQDSFQARGSLSVADAVVLGRHVEAEALLTVKLENRSLTLQVFLASDGTIVWRQSVDLHPSLLIREQIQKVVRAVAREFVASLPYQGVTLNDSLAKQAVFTEGGKRLARVKVGAAKVEVGDPVEWIVLSRRTLDPLFQGGAHSIVRAEGVVSALNVGAQVGSSEGVIQVEITRAPELAILRAGALVNLPNEQARLKSQAQPKDAAMAVVPAMIEPEAKQVERQKDETGAMATVLSILSSLAVILLLAF